MSVWTNIAIAARLTSGTRRDALRDLLAQRTNAHAPQVVIATPRRFVSLRKLLKDNAAVTAMLEVMAQTHRSAAALGATCQLQHSDRPDTAHTPALYLSHHTFLSPPFAQLRNAGCDVWHFKAADLPRRETLDPDGFAGWSSLARKRPGDLVLGDVTQDQIGAFFANARANASAQTSKYAQSNIAVDLPETYVFVALQTIGDMVQRKAYVPMLDMLEMVVERFAGTGTTVVIKRHPKCTSRKVATALDAAGARAGVMITNGSIHQIMAGAQAVFTVNSGVGAESIVHNVPLYCFGAADYAAVAHQIASREELVAATTPIRFACLPDQVQRFYYYYRNIYQVRVDDELPDRLTALISAALERQAQGSAQ